jgi:lysylphosphatidylglycerol synthetase-like protein (DUF2156 family)
MIEQRTGPRTRPRTGTSPESKPAEIQDVNIPETDFQRIEDIVRLMGKDPEKISISEAKEIARILGHSNRNVSRDEYRSYYLWFFSILGIYVTASIVGIVVITLYGKTVPISLVVIASIALGLFTGVLAMSGLLTSGLNK